MSGNPLQLPLRTGESNGKIPLLRKEGLGGILFGWAWRFAILSLPWQTRWFADATLGGWTWEQGRTSLYLSWVPMIATIVCARCFFPKANAGVGWRKVMFGATSIFLLFFAASKCDPLALRAITQWSAQVFLLGLFGTSFHRARLSSRDVGAWFVISLLPHVFFGLWQFNAQEVVASSLFGIASQVPERLGVSVVQHGAARLLRMYGGFPHPNIFAGWLVIGVSISVWLATTSVSRIRVLMWSFVASLMSIAIVLTFARAAWIAAFVGALVSGVMLIRKRYDTVVRLRYGLFAILLSVVVTMMAAYRERTFIIGRLGVSERLEAKSVEDRTTSLKEGVLVFLRHPLLGTGPNAELLDGWHAQQSPTYLRAPLEPSHNVLLLALANLGLFGSMLLAYGAWHGRFLFFHHRNAAILFLPPVFIVSLVDHYPWSTWSGQVLITIVVLIIFLPWPALDGSAQTRQHVAQRSF